MFNGLERSDRSTELMALCRVSHRGLENHAHPPDHLRYEQRRRLVEPSAQYIDVCRTDSVRLDCGKPDR